MCGVCDARGVCSVRDVRDWRDVRNVCGGGSFPPPLSAACAEQTNEQSHRAVSIVPSNVFNDVVRTVPRARQGVNCRTPVYCLG